MRTQQEIERTLDVVERRDQPEVVTILRWTLGDATVPETAPLYLDVQDCRQDDYEGGCNGDCECGGAFDGDEHEPTAVEVLDMLSDSSPATFTEGEAEGAIGGLADWELDNILTRCRQLIELCEAAKKASA